MGSGEFDSACFAQTSDARRTEIAGFDRSLRQSPRERLRQASSPAFRSKGLLLLILIVLQK